MPYKEREDRYRYLRVRLGTYLGMQEVDTLMEKGLQEKGRASCDTSVKHE
jgi:hypothetical protein